jgi:hypothetical protein
VQIACNISQDRCDHMNLLLVCCGFPGPRSLATVRPEKCFIG